MAAALRAEPPSQTGWRSRDRPARAEANPLFAQRQVPPSARDRGRGPRPGPPAPRRRGHGQGLRGPTRRVVLRRARRRLRSAGPDGSMAGVSDRRPPLRVMLVDDHEVVRSGIAALLKATDDIVVAGEAGTVREAIDEADRTRPEVVVMDVRLADGSGIEATREIRARRPQTPVLMVTSFADDDALLAAIVAGAS